MSGAVPKVWVVCVFVVCKKVNLDDCWMASTRSQSNEMVADPDRFPNGIKALADYVHSKGLFLGMYTDIGTATCGGFPGIDGNYVGILFVI